MRYNPSIPNSIDILPEYTYASISRYANIVLEDIPRIGIDSYINLKTKVLKLIVRIN
jgi:hypothetical protein